MPARRRADAERNYARILAVAEEQVAAHGVNASLEQIARIAGVGSATVRRHFPTRRELLEAVSRERIEALGTRARQLIDSEDPRNALIEWLNEVVAYSVAARGLAAVLAPDDTAPDPAHVNSCSGILDDAATPLLQRAARAGAVPASVTLSDLLMLIAGIAMATEHHPDAAAQAGRLFRLAVDGLSPHG